LVERERGRFFSAAHEGKGARKRNERKPP
jgi:hypothetical protein